MYLKLKDAVRLGVTLSGTAPWFFDRGEVVVFVENGEDGKRGAK